MERTLIDVAAIVSFIPISLMFAKNDDERERGREGEGERTRKICNHNARNLVLKELGNGQQGTEFMVPHSPTPPLPHSPSPHFL